MMIQRFTGVFTAFLLLASCKSRNEPTSQVLDVSDDRNHLTFAEAKALFTETHAVHDMVRELEPTEPGLVPSALRKFRRLMRQPFVFNNPSAVATTGSPEFIKGAQWNILYGTYVDAIGSLFAGEFDQLQYHGIKTVAPFGPILKWLQRKQLEPQQQRLSLEAEALARPDFIVLNEVDWGLSRSNYRNVAKDLAVKLGMNYAFATNYIEIDNFYSVAPSFVAEANELLSVLRSSKQRQQRVLAASYEQWLQNLQVDPARFKGLSGNVVLSRFPIRRAYMINAPRELEFKDWFEQEKQRPSIAEWLKRVAIKQTFQTERVAMVRYGMHNLLVVELEVLGAANDTVTVAVFHPEIFATPAQRRAQIQFAVEQLRHVTGPVVFAGDMNTSGEDGSNWSGAYLMKRVLTDPHAWFSQTLNHLVPGAGGIASALNYVKNFKAPDAVNIPVIAPNAERPLFDYMERFQFADGGKFDQRFAKDRIFLPDAWGNSNERESKGFVPTFETNAKVLEIGSFKLDWFFVKPGQSRDGAADYLAPAAAIVARNLAHQVKPGSTGEGGTVDPQQRVSDHHPSVVYLRVAPK